VVTLSLQFTAASQQADWLPIEVQLEQPYVALQEAARLAANSRSQLGPVRSAIERERDEKINQCRDARKHSQRAQSTARKELKEINGSHPETRTRWLRGARLSTFKLPTWSTRFGTARSSAITSFQPPLK